MRLIKLKARAKINLSLDVIKRWEDGYHEVKMVMQTLELHDTVLIEPVREGIYVRCNSKYVPSGKENIAFKAAELMLSEYGVKSGVRINIVKRIPVAAGLAGGSSDAAAVLNGLNRLFSLRLDKSVLMSMGKRLGADVPYCIAGGTVLAEGIGEVLTPLKPLKDVNVVLIKPKIGVSTAWVYKKLNLAEIEVRPDTQKMIDAIGDGNLRTIAENMVNVLETVTLKEYDIVKEAKNKLLEFGAIGSMMSGSGPSVFGIFHDKPSAEYACKKLRNSKWNCFLTYTN